MKAQSTLYSKLKVLVAKLYKAEKLYASMRNTASDSRLSDHKHPYKTQDSTSSSANSSNNLRSRRVVHRLEPSTSKLGGISSSDIFPSGVLIDHANEIRSLEWYRVHNSFRVKLNDILSEGNTSSLSLDLNRLWHDFCCDFEHAESCIHEARAIACDAIEKEEYAHLLKISSELIKRKAHLQALKVIHDELQVLISPLRQKNSRTMSVETLDVASHDSIQASNVIPLRRKAAS